MLFWILTGFCWLLFRLLWHLSLPKFSSIIARFQPRAHYFSFHGGRWLTGGVCQVGSNHPDMGGNKKKWNWILDIKKFSLWASIHILLSYLLNKKRGLMLAFQAWLYGCLSDLYNGRGTLFTPLRGFTWFSISICHQFAILHLQCKTSMLKIV